jgi:hypothetical protein
MRRAALLVGSVLFTLAVVEAGLRILGFSYPSFYTADAVVGVKHRPGVQGWYSQEGRSWVVLNSKGLRDREHATRKPAGTFRIVVLGDSFAEALQVPVEQAFWSILERELSQCQTAFGGPVEIINLGVSDYGTAQELLTLERDAWPYDPDMVLLAFFTGNDLRNNSIDLEWRKARPFYVFRGDELVLDTSFTERASQRLRYGALWRQAIAASDDVRLIQLAILIRQRIAAMTAGTTADGEGIDDEVYRSAGMSAAWKDTWRVTEELLLKFRDDVKAHGARPLLVTLSNGIQVDPHPEVRRAFTARFGIRDLFYPDRRIRAFAESAGIDVVTLAPAMLANAEATQRYLHGFSNNLEGRGHWNQAGHAVAAEEIRRALCMPNTARDRILRR